MGSYIQEPRQFDLKWYSHKFKDTALHYEIGLCIETRWIVWVNGPFPAGEWSDMKIMRSGINQYLENCECHVGDGGFYDE